MKILHCCLACFYIDNYGYQENLLPKQHQKDGHEVEILASTETFIDHKALGYVQAGSYISESGIPVTRVQYSNLLPHFLMKKFRMYNGIMEVLDRFAPDIIFLHDCQFLSMTSIKSYAKRNPTVTIFVDCHTDFINSGRNLISKYIMHKMIYRSCARMIEPYAKTFYGVLPVRCDFLHETYGIPRNKIKLLELGAEDAKIHLENRTEMREMICKDLEIGKDDFVIITGGKMDSQKNTKELVHAIGQLRHNNVKLIMFGSMTDDVLKVVEEEINTGRVKYIGWINAEKVYDYLTISDLAIFPGLHSVLWEQAVACGVPCVFRDIKGIHHVDTGGNSLFLRDGSAEEILRVLDLIISDKQIYAGLKLGASCGANRFMYSDIARRSLLG